MSIPEKVKAPQYQAPVVIDGGDAKRVTLGQNQHHEADRTMYRQRAAS